MFIPIPSLSLSLEEHITWSLCVFLQSRYPLIIPLYFLCLLPHPIFILDLSQCVYLIASTQYLYSPYYPPIKPVNICSLLFSACLVYPSFVWCLICIYFHYYSPSFEADVHVMVSYIVPYYSFFFFLDYHTCHSCFVVRAVPFFLRVFYPI